MMTSFIFSFRKKQASKRKIDQIFQSCDFFFSLFFQKQKHFSFRCGIDFGLFIKDSMSKKYFHCVFETFLKVIFRFLLFVSINFNIFFPSFLSAFTFLFLETLKIYYKVKEYKTYVELTNLKCVLRLHDSFHLEHNPIIYVVKFP